MAMKLAAQVGEFVRQSCIEEVTANPERGAGQFLDARFLVADVPRDFTMLKRIAQDRPEPESLDGVAIEPRDKFAADAVAWIIAGLVNCRPHSGALQGNPQGKPGEPATDYLDLTRRRVRA